MATKGEVKRYIAANCPHVKVRWDSDWGEFRVAYKGLLPEREEAMAAYTDDAEDAIGMAATMERAYLLCVHEVDKTMETKRLEAALRR